MVQIGLISVIKAAGGVKLAQGMLTRNLIAMRLEVAAGAAAGAQRTALHWHATCQPLRLLLSFFSMQTTSFKFL
jgi:hypothetical protein